MRPTLALALLMLAVTAVDAQSPRETAPPAPKPHDARSTAAAKKEPVFRHPNVDAAWQAAQDSRRPVLVFVSAADCFYCRKMYKETLSRPEIARANNQRFETAFVNKEDQPEVVEKLGIKAFPTTLVVNPDGTLRTALRGFVEPKDYVDQVILGRKPTRHAARPDTPQQPQQPQR